MDFLKDVCVFVVHEAYKYFDKIVSYKLTYALIKFVRRHF